MPPIVRVNACCASYPTTCDACGTRIFENNWRLLISIDGARFIVHDNEGVCHDKLLADKKIIEPTFLSTRAV